MKLFLINRTDEADYDEYDSAVVCAEDEADARSIHPCGGDITTSNISSWFSSWCSEEKVVVGYLGEADTSIARGVVVASYNVG